MLAPNKASIYPEYLPDWAKPRLGSPIDALMLTPSANLYIDFRPALLAAKGNFMETLYYRTDSHWNSLGAGIAFKALADNVGLFDTTLQWPFALNVRVLQTDTRNGGDLSKLLHTADGLSDREPNVEIVGDTSFQTAIFDPDSNQTHPSGSVQFESSTKPLLLTSHHALNTRKVLWLRDSFGAALVPFMAATFSETMQVKVQHTLTNTKLFEQLVENWKPDYVFITVVERSSMSNPFMEKPGSEKPGQISISANIRVN
jgi:hypothetical protein